MTRLHIASVGLPVVAVVGLVGALHRQSQQYEPQGHLRSGQELMVVFIGASFCGAHKAPGFGENIEAMKVLLAGKAKATGRSFTTIAVALDWDVDEGLAFLRNFGKFDEILVGRNWTNEGAIRYIWHDFPGRPSVPQVVVLVRSVDVGKRTLSVVGERVLTRQIGVDEIRDWVAKGVPLGSEQ